jgi:hypothetical protein
MQLVQVIETPDGWEGSYLNESTVITTGRKHPDGQSIAASLSPMLPTNTLPGFLKTENNPLETAGYLEFGGAHIYSVLHGVPDPIARVLLVGPFASERYASYIPWVRWARFLAERRIEALRFDYRGVGESTGAFEDMSFSGWSEDVEFLALWLKAHSPDVPLILHGLELGALLAGKTFAAGIGDALVLWSVPKNANEVLRRPLARQVFMSFSERKPLSYYVRRLEANQPMDVDGYPWSGRLWRESFTFESPLDDGDGMDALSNDGRPMKVVRLEGGQASVLRGSSLGRYVFVNPNLSGLFADNFAWMARAAASTPDGSSRESRY